MNKSKSDVHHENHENTNGPADTAVHVIHHENKNGSADKAVHETNNTNQSDTMINQLISNNALFDVYGILLTQKQQEIYSLTFIEDLSLAEVAENLSISRAAVHDALKKAQSTLENYEAKLGIVTKDHSRKQLYDKLKQLVDPSNPVLQQLVNELEMIDEK